MTNRMPNSANAPDVMFHLHSQTNPQRHAEIGPLIMTHGEGVHVYDSNGKRYLEAMAGLWCASLGFSDKRLKAAVAAAYDKFGFCHSFNHKTPDSTIDLAQKLAEMSPIPETQVYFATSGSEATESMVKLGSVWSRMSGRCVRGAGKAGVTGRSSLKDDNAPLGARAERSSKEQPEAKSA